MLQIKANEFYSFMELIDRCDSVHLSFTPNKLIKDEGYSSEILLPFYVHVSHSNKRRAVGLLRPVIVDQLKKENARSKELGLPEVWDLRISEDLFNTERSDDDGPSVSFSATLTTPAARTEVMKEMCTRWRDSGIFSETCGPTKWRAEMYPVYADPFGVHDHPDTHSPGIAEGLNYVFEMERSACCLFGIITYGVHMNIYETVLNENGQKSLRVWVPTRSRTKQTWPSFLDNSVAGGIPSGMPIFEALVKECMEEASLDEDIVRKYVYPTGSLSYFIRTREGWLQPEVEYVYDLLVPSGIDKPRCEPRPQDGEVESFELMSHEGILQKLHQGLFKPNCGLVIIDLLIRLGYIAPDAEPDYMNVITRMHRRFNYENL